VKESTLIPPLATPPPLHKTCDCLSEFGTDFLWLVRGKKLSRIGVSESAPLKRESSPAWRSCLRSYGHSSCAYVRRPLQRQDFSATFGFVAAFAPARALLLSPEPTRPRFSFLALDGDFGLWASKSLTDMVLYKIGVSAASAGRRKRRSSCMEYMGLGEGPGEEAGEPLAVDC